MGTAIVVFILLVIVISAVKGTIKRVLYGSACCGERERPEKKVKVKDRKKSHYCYKYKISVSGMHCSNCVRHVENALNSIEGIWAKANLGQKKVTVLSKTEYSFGDFEKFIDDAGYTALSMKEI